MGPRGGIKRRGGLTMDLGMDILRVCLSSLLSSFSYTDGPVRELGKRDLELGFFEGPKPVGPSRERRDDVF